MCFSFHIITHLDCLCDINENKTIFKPNKIKSTNSNDSVEHVSMYHWTQILNVSR